MQGKTEIRRKLLAAAGVSGLGLLAGFPVRSAYAAAACVLTPEQTEGPYFVDQKLNRSDLRSDPSDGSLRAGVPLLLDLTVSRVTPNGCRPLPDAMVDVWHCDATGVYSDVQDRRRSSAGKQFLRGYQITDAAGKVRFTTIYPGRYAGRAVHIHFKVRSSGKELTSQFYFDDALTDRVLSKSPYPGNSRGAVRNQQDSLFRDGGSALVLPLAMEGEGFRGRFDIGFFA